MHLSYNLDLYDKVSLYTTHPLSNFLKPYILVIALDRRKNKFSWFLVLVKNTCSDRSMEV